METFDLPDGVKSSKAAAILHDLRIRTIPNCMVLSKASNIEDFSALPRFRTDEGAVDAVNTATRKTG